MRFTGNIEAKTDNKGRVFLPACFRRILQSEECDKVILRKDPHQQCLVLYPETTWNKLLDELRARLNRWDAHDQMLFRMFVSDAEELAIDSNGRILLQKRYRDIAAISQEVRFIGMDDTIEVWAKEILEQPFMSSEEFSKELEKVMQREKGGNNE
ncbi:MAG: division/cell wall cluster transcriptional repressor MraZ [Bacteroidaceae bacterium]|nr:division/cell wall cluster transcriptional repressor MraZ [Bacteroidaceae bacterium]